MRDRGSKMKVDGSKMKVNGSKMKVNGSKMLDRGSKMDLKDLCNICCFASPPFCQNLEGRPNKFKGEEKNFGAPQG